METLYKTVHKIKYELKKTCDKEGHEFIALTSVTARSPLFDYSVTITNFLLLQRSSLIAYPSQFNSRPWSWVFIVSHSRLRGKNICSIVVRWSAVEVEHFLNAWSHVILWDATTTWGDAARTLLSHMLAHHHHHNDCDNRHYHPHQHQRCISVDKRYLHWTALIVIIVMKTAQYGFWMLFECVKHIFSYSCLCFECSSDVQGADGIRISVINQRVGSGSG